MKHYGTLWLIPAGVAMRKMFQLRMINEDDTDLSELEKIIRNLKPQFNGEVAKVQPEVKHTSQHTPLCPDICVIYSLHNDTDSGFGNSVNTRQFIAQISCGNDSTVT